MTQASTALSIVSPAGAAVGHGRRRTRCCVRGGSTPAAVGLAVAIAGIWNQLVNLAFPVVALALLTAAGPGSPGASNRGAHRRGGARGRGHRVRARPLARGVGAADRRLAPRGSSNRAAAGRAARAGGVGRSVVRALPLAGARAASPPLARHHGRDSRGPSHGLRAAARLPARHRRLRLRRSPSIEAFAAWALVRILGALPLTPAGVGIVEVGLTGALVAFGASNAEAVAATLLYRALTVFPTLALGLLAAATWRTHHPGETIGSPSDP